MNFKAFFSLAVLFFMLAWLPPSVDAYELLIGTEGRGSFSYFAGKSVCRTIKKFDHSSSCRAVPSEGYTDSLTNVQNGSLDMALVNSKMIYDAFHRAGLFQYVFLDYDQLRLLLPLYRTPVTLLVRRNAKIDSAADLVGKRVNGGAPFSLESIVFEDVMAAFDWQESSFGLLQNLSSANAQDYIALQGGSVQAMLHVGMHPDRKLEQSLKKRLTKLVGVNGENIRRLIDSGSGFSRQTIPAGLYPDQADAIQTLSLETLLITSADADSEMVELVLEAITTARRQLQYAHPAFLQALVDVETLNSSYLHPHPEAILFFQANQNRL